MYGYVYKTTNKMNGKIYVGQHKGEFTTDYLGSGRLLWKDIYNFGKINFSVELLCKCDSKEDLDNKERFYIKLLDSTNKDIGYNINKGGDGGDQTRNWTVERRNQYRLLQHNLTMCGVTPLLKYTSKPGPLNGMYGKKHSTKTRKLISDKCTGQHVGHTWNKDRVAVNNVQ